MSQDRPRNEAMNDPAGQVRGVEVDGGLAAVHQRNFDLLIEAAKRGRLCLTYAFDRVEERFRPVICVVSDGAGWPSLLPVAPMVDDEVSLLRFLPVAPGEGAAH